MNTLIKHNRLEKGFTLVEVLIAMVLGLLLVAGLLGVFQSNRTAAIFTKEQSVVQEDGRFAMNYVRSFFKIAGYDEFFKPLQSGQYSGAATLKISSSDSRDGASGGSDTLALYYEVPSLVSDFRTCNGSQPTSTQLKIKEVFSVSSGNQFTCQSYDATSGSVTAMGNAAVLASGVIDFQVTYAVNLTGDINVDPESFTYLNAGQVTAKGWGDRGIAQRVMAVKYALLIRAEDGIDTASSTANDIYYVLDNRVQHTGTVPSLYTSTFKFRNGG